MQVSSLNRSALGPAPRRGVAPVPRPPRASPVSVKASSSVGVVDKKQPDWTGEKVLSQLVNFLINTPPIWEVMKYFAKAAIKNTARKKGVEWDAYAQRLLADPELERLRQQFDTPGFKYPDYYLKPFHTYSTGNLEWLAAAEVRPASTVIACRTFKEMEDAVAAEARLRRGITQKMQDDLARRGLPAPSSILDAGCSTGISCRWLAEAFPQASITGLDASPYFLAVAEYEQGREPIYPDGRRVAFVHGLAEATGYPDASWDMVTFQFIAHECPQAALTSFITEARRILKPGGVLCFVDNNPRSSTIQNLPPAIFTLMKSTEPWSDEYYSFDLEGAMRAAGFEDVYTTEADHRHRAVFGSLPRA